MLLEGNSSFRNIKIYEGVCGASTSAEILDATRPIPIYGNQAEFSLEVYPNPATEKITMVYGMPSETYRVEITDVAGRTVWRDEVSGGTQGIVISKLSGGVYLLKVHTGSGILTHKFVKTE